MTSPSYDPPTRNDINLAFEELLLHHGPKFFLSLLNPENASHDQAVSYVADPLPA